MPGSTRTPRLPAVLLGVGALAILAVNANFPQIVEVLASVAIVWANLAYLFVTVPLLVRRLRAGAGRRRPDGLFHSGDGACRSTSLAVVWGVLIVVNVGWPRAEIYGDGVVSPVRGAPMATAAMLGAGWSLSESGRPPGGRRAGGTSGARSGSAVGRAAVLGSNEESYRMMSSRDWRWAGPGRGPDEGDLSIVEPWRCGSRPGASTSTRRSAWSWRPGSPCSWSAAAPRRSAGRSS